MRIKTRATIEDLSKVEGKAELVNGEIVYMPPTGDEPSSVGFEIASRLREYARTTQRGRPRIDLKMSTRLMLAFCLLATKAERRR